MTTNSFNQLKKTSISQAEFQQIINSVTGTNYSSCRVRLVFTLLFITGVKISSLLEFSVKKHELFY